MRVRHYRDGKLVFDNANAPRSHEPATSARSAGTVPDDRSAADDRSAEVDPAATKPKPGEITWIDIPPGDTRTLHALGEQYGLHPLAVEDVLERHQRPKLDRYDNQLFLTAYGLSVAPKGSAELVRREISAFILPDALITVRPDDAFDMGVVLSRWDAHPGLLAHGVGGMVWGLLDAIVDTHLDTVQQLDEVVDDLEESVFADNVDTRSVQRAAYDAHKQIVTLRRLALPMREVVGELLRRSDLVGGSADRHPAATEHSSSGNAQAGLARRILGGVRAANPHGDATRAQPIEPIAPYLQDVYDHTLRVADWGDSLRDMISTIIDTNMTAQGNRLNLVMKKVTSWAAIIAVPTLITGAYGMNVAYPTFGTTAGFWAALGLMVVASGALYAQFKRRDWL